jgi:hypothetical protein
MTKEIQARYQSDIVSSLSSKFEIVSLTFYFCIKGFIRFFSERLMNDVVEEIFNYLDYESLKNSEAVSSLWYNSILYGKTWKKLLERNVRQKIIIN